VPRVAARSALSAAWRSQVRASVRRQRGIRQKQQPRKDGPGHGEEFENRHGNHLSVKPFSANCGGRAEKARLSF
jgi:hypothetical protein